MKAKNILKLISDIIIFLVHLGIGILIMIMGYVNKGFDEMSRIETPLIEEIYPVIFGPLILILSFLFIIFRKNKYLLNLYIATLSAMIIWGIIFSFYDLIWGLITYLIIFSPIIILRNKKTLLKHHNKNSKREEY